MPTQPFDENQHKDVVDRLFTYHPPYGNQSDRYEELRRLGKHLARIMLTLCPPSRERSIALTKLEEAIMWANASIARNETQKISGE